MTINTNSAQERTASIDLAQLYSLPRWIDDQKGKDPLMDDVIHYIEQLLARRSLTSGAPADEQVQQVLPPWPEPVSAVTHERETIAPWVTDKQIVDALHSLGIDTEMSKYGFPEIQVRGTNVPNIRRLVAKLAAPNQAGGMVVFSNPCGRGHDWVADRLASAAPAHDAAAPSTEGASAEDHPALVAVLNDILTDSGWTKYRADKNIGFDAESVRMIFNAGQMSAGAAAKNEQTVCAPNCFYGDCPPCMAAGLRPSAAGAGSTQAGDSAAAARTGDVEREFIVFGGKRMGRTHLAKLERDAARYRVLRQHVLPHAVGIQMDRQPPASQPVEERIDLRYDIVIERRAAAQASSSQGGAALAQQGAGKETSQ